jgi:hypothetical protein
LTFSLKTTDTEITKLQAVARTVTKYAIIAYFKRPFLCPFYNLVSDIWYKDFMKGADY